MEETEGGAKTDEQQEGPRDAVPAETGVPEAASADTSVPAAVTPKRRTWPLWIAVAAGVAALVGAGAWAWTKGPLKGWRGVASVNGSRISRTELDDHLGYLTKVGRLPAATPADDEARLALERAILDDLIVRRLLAVEAEKLKIRVEPGEEDVIFGQAHGGKPGDTKLSETSQKVGQDAERMRAEVRYQLLVKRLAEKITEGVALTDEEVVKYYGENQQAFVMPGAVKLRLLVTATREEADHLRQRIVAGGDFAAIARDHSQGAAKENGGDLGWVDLRTVPAAIADAVKAIPGTGITPVIPAGDKFFVLRVEGRQGSRQVPLAEVKEQLKPALLLERKRQKFSEWLAEVRNKANIEIY